MIILTPVETQIEDLRRRSCLYDVQATLSPVTASPKAGLLRTLTAPGNVIAE